MKKSTEKESVSEEEQEWQNKLMAKVDDFLYVREKADSDSEIVGKMYKGGSRSCERSRRYLDKD